MKWIGNNYVFIIFVDLGVYLIIILVILVGPLVYMYRLVVWLFVL